MAFILSLVYYKDFLFVKKIYSISIVLYQEKKTWFLKCVPDFSNLNQNFPLKTFILNNWFLPIAVFCQTRGNNVC